MEGLNMERETRFIARTAMLLAAAFAIQFAGRFLGSYNNFIVGPVINACLLIATAFVSPWSGITIGVITPFASLVNNHSPVVALLLPFSPLVAIGNIILVVCFYFIMKKNAIAAVITGAVLKFAFLFASVSLFLNIITNYNLISVPPLLKKNFLFLFSWPQLVTALAGGIIALSVIKALKPKSDMDI